MLDTGAPCPTCGSWADECPCDYAREISLEVQALGLTLQYDETTHSRRLREIEHAVYRVREGRFNRLNRITVDQRA